MFEDITRPDKVRGVIGSPEVERQDVPEPAQRRAEGPPFSWEELVQVSRPGGQAMPGQGLQGLTFCQIFFSDGTLL